MHIALQFSLPARKKVIEMSNLFMDNQAITSLEQRMRNPSFAIRYEGANEKEKKQIERLCGIEDKMFNQPDPEIIFLGNCKTRAETLIRRAILDEADQCAYGYNFEKSNCEIIEGREYVILRGKHESWKTVRLEVFSVEEDDTVKLVFEEWPSHLREEYENFAKPEIKPRFVRKAPAV